MMKYEKTVEVDKRYGRLALILIDSPAPAKTCSDFDILTQSFVGLFRL